MAQRVRIADEVQGPNHLVGDLERRGLDRPLGAAHDEDLVVFMEGRLFTSAG